MLTSHVCVGSSDSGTGTKKKKKKKKKKKSSVKRTRTSFMFFHKAVRPSVKEANPGELLGLNTVVRTGHLFPVNQIVQRPRNTCAPCATHRRQEFRGNYKARRRAVESSPARRKGGHCKRLWMIVARKYVTSVLAIDICKEFITFLVWSSRSM